MIYCEPGSFTMGQSDISNASPEHEVTLTQGFYLGKYEVTQAQYEAVMTGNTETDILGNVFSATPSTRYSGSDRPVETLSWDAAQVFLARLNTLEAGNIPAGWAYVLPTEAQWEYACRAGTTTIYSWGDTITPDDANYNWDGDGYDGSDFKASREVGSYDPNPWGFFDMHGNVWEWTADRNDGYGGYSSGAQTDPEGPASGVFRVLRGGAWNNAGSGLSSAVRTFWGQSYSNHNFGFRLALKQI
ncbi:formylglycine-generating enzyme family protein, partial [bacterium]|nr:formylglycine-generating enzyme family protein [bacterium]